MENRISKEDWIAMFQEIGLDDEKMEQWHRLFEVQHPQAHEEFLRHLGLAPEEIARVRAL